MTDPILQRIAATIAALACFVVSAKLPQFSAYLVPVGLSLLTAVHITRPGDAPKEKSDASQDR